MEKSNNQPIKKEQAIVIGNGESRAGLNLNHFKDDYTLIGCNALSRDFDADLLVCCDYRMVEESVKITDSKIYTREENYKRKVFSKNIVFPLPELPFPQEQRKDEPRNWGSGPYAVYLAALGDFKTVYLLGFDLYGREGKINNLYKGTENYSDPSKKSVDPAYWIYQISKIFKFYSNKQFVLINNQDWKIPHDWQLDNVAFSSLDDFCIDNKYLSSII